MKRNRFFSLLIGIALLAALGACGNSEAQTEDSAEQASVASQEGIEESTGGEAGESSETAPESEPASESEPEEAEEPAAVDGVGNGVILMAGLREDRIVFQAEKEIYLLNAGVIVDGEEIDFKSISNTQGDMFADTGATMWPGSSIMNPKTSSMLSKIGLRSGTTVECVFETAPGDGASVIYVETEGDGVMQYDLAAGAWIED